MVGLTVQEAEAVVRVIDTAEAFDNEYSNNVFNIHRWITAWNSEQDAADNLRRHLVIRNIMPIPPSADERSELMEKYAPITILGRNRKSDNKILLLEQSGKIDIAGLVDNIQLSSFMKNKFRMMEKLHKKVEEEERRTNYQSGGVLIMDLQGLGFSTNLLAVLAGPYRIMWGTLFEQYPQLIQQIIIINAPKFVNLLYQTCIPFIPADYKEKILISSDTSALHKTVDLDCIPKEYGGTMDSSGEFEILYEIQAPINPIPEMDPISQQLISINIPAGGYMVETYKWKQDIQLEFYLQNEQEFTYFIFFAEDDTDDQGKWKEVYAGCERPALKQVDNWEWKTPHKGYYYIRYGNEKAWLFSVTVNKLINSKHGEVEEPQIPIKVFQI